MRSTRRHRRGETMRASLLIPIVLSYAATSGASFFVGAATHGGDVGYGGAPSVPCVDFAILTHWDSPEQVTRCPHPDHLLLESLHTGADYLLCRCPIGEPAVVSFPDHCEPRLDEVDPRDWR